MIGTRHLRLALVGMLGGAYLWLGHMASISDDPPAIGLLVGLLPLLAFAAVLAWHSRHRLLALTALAACVATLLAFLDTFRHDTAWIYFLQHAGTHGLLALGFGRSLFARHEDALCSRVAAVLHDPLPASLARYTWQVTLAWTLYFVLAGLTSVVLFFFGPIEVWSVFANLLTPFLLGLMFVGDHFVRRRVLPEIPPLSVAATIRAYQDYSRRQAAARHHAP